MGVPVVQKYDSWTADLAMTDCGGGGGGERCDPASGLLTEAEALPWSSVVTVRMGRRCPRRSASPRRLRRGTPGGGASRHLVLSDARQGEKFSFLMHSQEDIA